VAEQHPLVQLAHDVELIGIEARGGLELECELVARAAL
jgi:hypothetical protein